MAQVQQTERAVLDGSTQSRPPSTTSRRARDQPLRRRVRSTVSEPGAGSSPQALVVDSLQALEGAVGGCVVDHDHLESHVALAMAAGPTLVADIVMLLVRVRPTTPTAP
jgi:hypothetical protein